jgi:hypothetical protein
MGYDQKCYDLAEAFLDDTPEINTTANTERLAQLIQDTIEDEIGDMQLRAVMPSSTNEEK